MNDLNYIVFDNFEVTPIDSKSETNASPLFYIKSVWYKKSGGQGLLNYYKHVFFDSDHSLIEGNRLKYNDIEFVVDKEDKWGCYKGNNYSVVLKAEVTDRLGKKVEKKFLQTSKNRFDSLFSYMKLLNKVDTHNACTVIEDKDYEIKELKKKLSIKNTIANSLK